ncbi:MAG: threonine/serine dehydratase [Rhodospirillales bacterium]|nr:threonine/serine dehydratase [Rhodospirillales bacterium]
MANQSVGGVKAVRKEPPTLDDVYDAASRLQGVAVYTPLLESQVLNDLAGGRVLLKMETLQRTGSFKFRGAYNRISRLSSKEKDGGIIAFSSGNHAQGAAAAAQLAGVSALIMMPSDAPQIKVAGTRSYGAEVMFYDYRKTGTREETAARLAAERNATIVPPYDDPYIIAGQGTVALEILAQANGMNVKIDSLLVPCSGGGLTAGCAIVMDGMSPGTSVYSVEPKGFEDTARSLASGERVSNQPDARSFCDALLISPPGEITFAVNRAKLAGGLVVSDDEVADAIAFAFRRLKLVIEPGGSVGLAAVLAGKIDCAGKTIAVVCSGANVDPKVFCKALERSAHASPSENAGARSNKVTI